MEQGNAIAHHPRAEGGICPAPHQDAIAGNQTSIHWRTHIDAHAAVLDKQHVFIPAVVCHRGLEGDGQRLAGLGIGEGVNGAQGD
jgi:hypothetical protein